MSQSLTRASALTNPFGMDSCPWSFLTPSVIDFCEANRCAWIVEPANSTSCSAFVLAGLYLLRRARRDGADGLLRLMGPMAVSIGVFSVALHGTMTLVGGFLDLMSMYLLATMMLLLSVQRLGHAVGLGHYLAANGALALAHILAPRAGVPLFGGLIAAFAVLELVLWRRGRRTVDYRWFWATAAIFLGSLGVWALDISRTLCAPESWLQGHAIWHCGCAASTVTLYFYFRQFNGPSRLSRSPATSN